MVSIVSDKSLDRLKVPRSQRARLRGHIERLVADAHRNFEPWSFRASEVAPPLKEIARLAQQLGLALADYEKRGDRIAHGVRTRLDLELRTQSATPSNDDYVALHRHAVAHLADAAGKAAERASRELKSKGRPIANPKLAHFVTLLIGEVLFAGGKVTIDKRMDDGTLIDLLDELKPQLPKGILPRRHPTSTYSRIILKATAHRHNLRSDMGQNRRNK